MKKIIIISMTLLAFGMLGCQSKPKSNVISAETFIAMKEADESIKLIDVRTLEEYLEKRIPNAYLLPLNQINTRAHQIMPDKHATYVIYCRSGQRSAEAIAILEKMGYVDLYDLGGIIDWPFDTTSG